MRPLDDRERARQLLRWATIGNVVLPLLIVVFFGLSTVKPDDSYFWDWDWRSTMATWGMLAAVAAGAGAFGVLIGFIFGIPRQRSTPEGEELQPRGHVAQNVMNSNLGEVSDWLTKLLLGAGLASLAAIPGAFGAFSVWIEAGLDGVDGAGRVAVGLAIYGLAAWFVWGWLYTALWLLPALNFQQQQELTALHAARGTAKDPVLHRAEAEAPPDERESAVDKALILSPELDREPSRSKEAQLDRARKVVTAARAKGEEALSALDYRNLARQSKRAKRYEEAAHYYRRAAEVDPEDPSPLAFAGAIYSVYLGDYERADEMYARVLALDPDNAQPLYSRACNEARRGNEDEALDSLARAIELGGAKYRALARRASRPDRARPQYEPPFAGLAGAAHTKERFESMVGGPGDDAEAAATLVDQDDEA